MDSRAGTGLFLFLVVVILVACSKPAVDEQASDATAARGLVGVCRVADQAAAAPNAKGEPECDPSAAPPPGIRRITVGRATQVRDIPSVSPTNQGKLPGGIILAPRRGATDSPFGTSVRGQTAGDDHCRSQHYLLGILRDGSPGYNRFDWWSRQPPASGAVTESFRCEFSTALATTIGGTPAPGDTSTNGYQSLLWDGSVDGSPNGTRGIGFAVRTEQPRSVPVLRNRSVPSADGTANTVTLINESAPDHTLQLGQNEFRPSLWIDFDTPQRAVGLEYGHLPVEGVGDATIDAEGVKLLAYDREGIFLVGSNGLACETQQDGTRKDPRCRIPLLIAGSNLDSKLINQRIGVRDRDGRISTVELRFQSAREDLPPEGGGPGRKIVEPQVISRVWHEPLPPAAVLQDVVGIEARSPGDTRSESVFRVPDFSEQFGVAPGARAIRLPFRFDRAAALLRGFRFETLDFTPHEVNNLVAGLTQDSWQFDRTAATRVVTVSPTGTIDASGEQFPFRVALYFTLVAWDSDQTSIDVSAGSTGFTSFIDRAAQIATSGTSNQNNHLVVERSGDRLFGGIQTFRYALSLADEIDHLTISAGRQRGFGNPSSDAPGLATLPGGGSWWGFLSLLESPDDAVHSLQVDGAVLQGHLNSLRLGADASALPAQGESDPANDRAATRHSLQEGNIPISVANLGPRRLTTNNSSGQPVPDREFFYSADVIRDNFGWAWPVAGDAAFLGLNHVWFYPEGPIQQLDVELQGESYDGRIVDWKLGAGVNTEPAIIGGAGADRARSVFALPIFGAVARNRPFAEGSADWSPLLVRDAIVGCANRYPRNVGSIRSRGEGALLITGLQQGTTSEDAYFEYQFHWRGRHLTLDQTRARLPLHLWKGEELGITTIYTPQSNRPIVGATATHHGSLIFQTNSPANSTITYGVTGTTLGGTPGGEWATDELYFGLIPSGQTRSATALLRTTGNTTLCVNSLFIEQPTLGFEVVSASNAVEPEVLAIRVQCGGGTALHSCTGTTHLVARTNAGDLRLPVSGNVARATPPPAAQPPPCVEPDDYFRGCHD